MNAFLYAHVQLYVDFGTDLDVDTDTDIDTVLHPSSNQASSCGMNTGLLQDLRVARPLLLRPCHFLTKFGRP